MTTGLTVRCSTYRAHNPIRTGIRLRTSTHPLLPLASFATSTSFITSGIYLPISCSPRLLSLENSTRLNLYVKYQYISNNFYLSCAPDGTRTHNTRFKRPVRSLLLSICATEAFLVFYICFRFRSGSQDQICFRFIILIITVWEPQESNL